jgi:hypothetical protein
LLLLVPLYIGIRVTGSITIADVQSTAASVFDEGRTDSLRIRLVQEELFTARAMERPMFGWGRASRAWPMDAYTGREMVGMWDSLWIIFFSLNGFFGLATWIICMLTGPWLTLRRIIKTTTPQRAESSIVIEAMLSLIVIIFMVDSLFNGMVNTVYILISGAIVSSALRIEPAINKA